MNQNCRRASTLALLVALSFAVGCRKVMPKPTSDTGARAVTESFFTALINQDWPAAYRCLHPDERERLTIEQFTERAARYRQNLIFTPKGVVIRSCDEHGDMATAYITITARDSRHHQFRDAIILRRASTGWGVALPPNFGATRR
jgi:hypothetical protein